MPYLTYISCPTATHVSVDPGRLHGLFVVCAPLSDLSLCVYKIFLRHKDKSTNHKNTTMSICTDYTHATCKQSLWKAKTHDRNGPNRICWLCLVPTSSTRIAIDWDVHKGQKFIRVIQGKYFYCEKDIKFLNIEWRTLYSLTNFEDHFGLHASVIFLTPICVVSATFVCWLAPKLQWSIGRTNCLYYSARGDLYIHVILGGKVRVMVCPRDKIILVIHDQLRSSTIELTVNTRHNITPGEIMSLVSQDQHSYFHCMYVSIHFTKKVLNTNTCHITSIHLTATISQWN